MTVPLSACIARIFGRANEIVGAGWLCGPGQLVSCAHVIARAIGIPPDSATPPGDAEVFADFPLIEPGRRLRAQIEYWLPIGMGGPGAPIDDLAGLKLLDAPHASCNPPPIASAQDCWGDTFRAFGYPLGSDSGAWASGVVRDRLANGCHQIEDIKQEGYRIEPGFSGSPVWNERLGAAIGMVVAMDAHGSMKVA